MVNWNDSARRWERNASRDEESGVDVGAANIARPVVKSVEERGG